jgi:mRNA-degrading endonuclease RelE of RelBE toxin-antitoxin system
LTDNVQFSKRAARDIERLSQSQRIRVRKVLDGLSKDPAPTNLDVRPLVGHEPWLRLRIGTLRLIFRRLTLDESRPRGIRGHGYLVERVVDRRDLDKAVGPL